MKRDIQRQINALEAELCDINSTSERKVREEYNVDSKEDIVRLIEEELEVLEAQLDYYGDDDECVGWCDPAFRSEADFYRMRI